MTEGARERMIELLPRLRRFAYAVTGNFDEADDLVQDACERALAHLDQWRPGTRLDSWMFRIAQNIWIDRGRSKRAQGEHASLDLVPDPIGVDGRDLAEHRLTLDVVAKGMSRLPPDQRVLMALVCIDGASYKEAADTLGIPVGTVMSRLARARQELVAAMNRTVTTSATSMPMKESARGEIA